MSVYNNIICTKQGATFASGEEAYADKQASYGPELLAEVNACYDKMLADGILLEPITAQWDQSTFTLTVIKLVSSIQDYNNAVTFNAALVNQLSEAAGWIWVNSVFQSN